MSTTMAHWMREFEERGAFWQHNPEKPKRPHVRLSSGDHSDGFFNAALIAANPRLMRELSRCLIAKLDRLELVTKRIDRVVGIARGGIVLAYDLAREIGAQTEQPCLAGYVEKDGVGGWCASFQPDQRENILLVDDVFSTGGNFTGAIACLESIHPKPFVWPKLLVLLNRSTRTYHDGRFIESLIHRPMRNWPLEEGCPLCLAGSEAITVVGPADWVRLTQRG